MPAKKKSGCGCPGCVAGLVPFSIDHFELWAAELVLDSGEKWGLEPFQAEFAADIFGGKRECWLVVPEGNGKSTLLAGIALHHAEHTEDGWVPIGAASRDQAKIIYRQASGFIRRTRRLDYGTFRCYDGYRRIVARDSRAQIEVFAADDRTGDGIIPTLALVDELHRHRSLDLYLTWYGKLDKRDGQILVISTAGEPGSDFEATREMFRQTATDLEREETHVRAAKQDSVLHEWAVPEDGDVEDLKLVARANPLSTVTPEKLARKKSSPAMTTTHWRRFVCNLPTRSDSAAIQEKEWFDAATTERIPAGEPVWLGLDVAWKWDTTAAVPLWIRDSEFRLLGPASVLVPPRDGSSLDPYKVERALLAIHTRNPVHTVVMDMSRAEQLGTWIEAELGARVIDRSQTNAFAALDYEKFMEALRMGWLRHTGDQALTRHALNAVARVLPQGDARFDRPHASRLGQQQDARVIDALIAAAMVHTTAASMVDEPEEAPVAWA